MKRMVFLWIFIWGCAVPLRAPDRAVKLVFDSFHPLDYFEFRILSLEMRCKILQSALLLPFKTNFAAELDFYRDKGDKPISLVPTCLVELQKQEYPVGLVQLENLIPMIHVFFQNLQAKMGEDDFYSEARSTSGGVPVKWSKIVDIKTYLCPEGPRSVFTVEKKVTQWGRSICEYPVYASILVCDFALKGLARLLVDFSSLNDFEEIRLVEVLASWKEIKNHYYAQFVNRHRVAEIDPLDEKVSKRLMGMTKEFENYKGLQGSYSD